MNRTQVSDPGSTATVRVPFRLVPSLVAGRMVALEGGQAVIDSTAVKPFLSCVHRHFLAASLRSMAAGGRRMLGEDPRLRELVEAVATEFRAMNPHEIGATENTPLLASEVQAASANFPPCFAGAHQGYYAVVS